jgi:hypothetical protein
VVPEVIAIGLAFVAFVTARLGAVVPERRAADGTLAAAWK